MLILVSEPSVMSSNNLISMNPSSRAEFLDYAEMLIKKTSTFEVFFLS